MRTIIINSLIVAASLLGAMEASAATCYRSKLGYGPFAKGSHDQMVTMVWTGRLDEVDEITLTRGGHSVATDMFCESNSCSLEDDGGVLQVQFIEDTAKVIVKGHLIIDNVDGDRSVSVAAGKSTHVYSLQQISDKECKELVPEPRKIIMKKHTPSSADPAVAR